MKVKTVSLWQPWASLIAIGAKRIETRSWRTAYRGRLAIHAAKTLEGFEGIIEEGENGKVALDEPFRSVLLATGLKRLNELPLGAIVGVVDLVDCVATETLHETISEQERAFGNFVPGRFGWVLKNPRVFPAPIPWRGSQGFFNIELPGDLF